MVQITFSQIQVLLSLNWMKQDKKPSSNSLEVEPQKCAENLKFYNKLA